MSFRLTITLESDMCMGNGESKGNAVDSDICVNGYGVPFIPARRLKGCLRDTAEFLKNNGYMLDDYKLTDEYVSSLFGDPFGNEGRIVLNDANLNNVSEISEAINQLNKTDKEYLKTTLHPQNIEKCFTVVRGQTKIEDGVKVDGSLRFTRVLTKNNEIFNQNNPVSFETELIVNDVTDIDKKFIQAICKGTRHIGSNRNRGLGNVLIEIEELTSDKENKFIVDTKVEICEGKKYCLEYKINLDSQICVPGLKETLSYIPASSIIGCFANYYIKKYAGNSENFKNLFLNGQTIWSELTPVISGTVSIPVPMLLLELKNNDGKIINQYSQSSDDWKRYKPKTMEGKYAAEKEDGFVIASVGKHAEYHNSLSKEMLYTQEAIEAGYVFGGTVIFDGKYYNDICDMLSNASIRFGRSKNVQYSNCHILPEIIVNSYENREEKISGKIYVVLRSDLVINNGLNGLSSKTVREYICSALGFVENGEETDSDCIRYGTISGFNNMWHLQKMHTQVVKAGSVLCFNIEEASVPQNVQIGDLLQEGYGKISVYTESGIGKLNNNRKGLIDTEENAVDNQVVHGIEKALTLMVVRECLLRYARNYKKKADGVPVSRIRLMLQRADSYSEFREKINSIKEADVSSKSIGRKAAAINYIDGFCGNNSIDWKRLLEDEPGLYESIVADKELKAEVEKMWKLPIMEKLHALHYGKEKR